MDLKNFWYYYKWYVIIGLIAAGFLAQFIYQKVTTPKPDVQIAYAGDAKLSDDQVKTVEDTFAALCGDLNGDGKAVALVNQYVNGADGLNEDEAAGYQEAAEIKLIGDINDCESYFFLMQDPDQFELENHVLADADGNAPADDDYSADGRYVTWTSFAVAASSKDGAAEGNDTLNSLYIGRRGFYSTHTCDFSSELSRIWSSLW